MERISRMAPRAGKFIMNTRPSDIIPFKGKFPLLPNEKKEEYNRIIRSEDDVDSERVPDWCRELLLKGERMCCIEENFIEYLKNNGISIDEFKKKTSADKSTELIRFFDANSLSFNCLKVN